LLDHKVEDSEKIVNQLLSIAQESLGEDKVSEVSKKAAELFSQYDT